jgi:hypothetical protein
MVKSQWKPYTVSALRISNIAGRQKDGGETDITINMSQQTVWAASVRPTPVKFLHQNVCSEPRQSSGLQMALSNKTILP